MNRYYPHTIIAQEGWPFIVGGLVLSIVLSIFCGWWSAPFWLFVLFSLQFFRDPARDIPDAPDAVLCPADGRVVVVEKAQDPYRQTEALKISVFMNVFNVHSQRSPVTGTVTDVQYNAGKFFNAALDKASTENERNAVLMTTTGGRELTFVQVAGLVARRVLCYVKPNESMVRGERYGFIRFGSRVDVYLPLDAVANVAIGDKVRASETVLAYLPVQAGETAAPAETNSNTVPAAAAAVAAELTLDGIDAARAAAEAEAKAAAEQAAAQAQAEREAAEAAARAEAEQQARLAAEQEAQAQAEREAAEAAARAESEQQARLAAEQEAQAQAEREAAEAAARAEAEEQARLAAEQEAQAQAEREAAEAAARAEAEEQARLAAEQEAQAQAEREAAEAAARAEAEEQARLAAEQEAQAQAEREAAEAAARAEEQAQAVAEEPLAADNEAYRRAEEEALAEIAARAPIVRREVFASVPEPWQTIEPSEIIIKTEVKNKK